MFLSAILLGGSVGLRAEVVPGQGSDGAESLPKTEIVAEPLGGGGPAEVGSAVKVDLRRISDQSYTNPNRVLQQIPGVYARDEDGYGNFPNFSIRGADGVRSAKTSILEDGIPMGTAAYTFPADYHVPRIGRMSGVEVYKGSTQVRFGPHTTGGAINFLSTPFLSAPTDPSSVQAGQLKTTFGSDNTWLDHAWWGGSRRTGDGGAHGILLELFHNQSDGFRRVDRGAGGTGFQVLEPMVRLFWEPGTAARQRLEYRFGYSVFDTAETHLGLTDLDLAANPVRRYVSTRFDEYTSEQFRNSLRHSIRLTDGLRLENTLYQSRLHRDWYKLHDIRTPSGRLVPLATALATPGEPLDILRGDAAGLWRIRSNDRTYDQYGFQGQLDWNGSTGSLEHGLTAGARVHPDDADRFERDDVATVDSAGEMTRFDVGRQGAAGNRFEGTRAFAMFVEDRIRVGRWTVRPGLRWEHLDAEYRDRDTTGPDPGRVLVQETGTLDALAPGVLVEHEIEGGLSLFGGYHRGISTPAPREMIRGDARLETSDAFELGFRREVGAWQVQLTGFHTTLHDMIANEGLGGLGAVVDSNAGDGRLQGFEGSFRWDVLPGSGSGWRLPVRGSTTYTRSRFLRGNPLATPSSIYAGAVPGNELPYVPTWAASSGFGLENSRFGAYVDATYLDEMQGSASNAADLRDPAGNPDARYGRTDAAVLVDLSVHFQATPAVRILGGVANLGDERPITSRLPAGARAGRPRFLHVGVQVRF